MSTLTLTAGAVRTPAGSARRPRAVRLPGAVRLTAARGRGVSAARPASLHLTRRGRLVLLLVALAIAFGGSAAATRAEAGGPASAPVVERYVVAPGDTLWEIAAGLAKPGEDVRDVVRELQVLNKLASGGLTAGQELVLPVGR